MLVGDAIIQLTSQQGFPVYLTSYLIEGIQGGDWENCAAVVQHAGRPYFVRESAEYVLEKIAECDLKMQGVP